MLRSEATPTAHSTLDFVYALWHRLPSLFECSHLACHQFHPLILGYTVIDLRETCFNGLISKTKAPPAVSFLPDLRLIDI